MLDRPLTEEEIAEWLKRFRFQWGVSVESDLPLICFSLAYAKGFWDLCEIEGIRFKIDPSKRNFGEMIALMHSELSEALEADRKKLADEKLPQYPGVWVELVDCLIRIFDYLGANEVPWEEILAAKLEFNLSRPRKHGKDY